jgi:hypothetical protein
MRSPTQIYRRVWLRWDANGELSLTRLGWLRRRVYERRGWSNLRYKWSDDSEFDPTKLAWFRSCWSYGREHGYPMCCVLLFAIEQGLTECDYPSAYKRGKVYICKSRGFFVPCWFHKHTSSRHFDFPTTPSEAALRFETETE